MDFWQSRSTSNFSSIFSLGKTVGGSPWITILVSLIVCAACMVGFLRFEQESRGEELWVPQDAKAQHDRKWVEETFPEESTPVNFILEKPNVLTVDVMKKVGFVSRSFNHRTIKSYEKYLGCFCKTLCVSAIMSYHAGARLLLLTVIVGCKVIWA